MIELTEIARKSFRGAGVGVLSRVQGVDDLLVFQVNGNFDMYYCKGARSLLAENGFSYDCSSGREIEADPKRPSIIYDLTCCRYLDSTGLGLMIGGLKATRVDHNFFGVVTSNPQIKKIFNMTGINTIMTLYKTLDDAVEDCQFYASSKFTVQ